jgi:hypothetical protein
MTRAPDPTARLWSESLHRLERPIAPWGRYGDVLLHGLCEDRDDDTDPLPLLRTGPFVPPLSQPFGGLVVTTRFRQQLLESELTGFSFQPVQLVRVVRIPWQEWDPDTELPAVMPFRDDPENYVLAGDDEAELRSEIGRLFELRVDREVEVNRSDGVRIVEGTWDRSDFVRPEGTRWTVVSERARDWLEDTAAEWVRFLAVRTV